MDLDRLVDTDKLSQTTARLELVEFVKIRTSTNKVAVLLFCMFRQAAFPTGYPFSEINLFICRLKLSEAFQKVT